MNLLVDSPVLPDLLGQIPQDEDIGTVTADGAYDRRYPISLSSRWTVLATRCTVAFSAVM